MDRSLQRFLLPFIFIASFGLYLNTMGPTLVPYRDAGEMATTVTRLGIVHPPGYPAYTLLGHLFTKLPFANPAYRLNLLSALSLAMAWVLLFMLARSLWGTAPAFLAVLLGVVSFQFWMHALISEMYAMNLLVISALLWLLVRQRYEAAAFLFGAGLGVRMDLLLCGPAFAVLFFGQVRAEDRKSVLLRCILFFSLGASVFVYLLIRSNGQPLLNWGDPSTFERFFASVSRRSYGSSLDLLSQSYQTGENFLSQMALYVRHVARDFSLLSLPLAVFGLFDLWKRNNVWLAAVGLGWLFTGPLFIFLGNLPINPHAVAIMEAAYLTPDVFFLLAVGAGLTGLRSLIPAKAGIQNWTPASAGVTAVYLLVTLIVAAQAVRFYPAVSKRRNWMVHDFIRNVLYSVPEPSLIVARSDVPLFSLFYGHWIHPGLTWRVPVAQGLAGSAWYPVMMARQIPKLQLGPLNTAEEWGTVAASNPGWSLYGTPDTDWPLDLYSRMVSSGLLMQYLPRGRTSLLASDTWLNEFSVYRGRYRYDAYYEYFTPELIEEYAKAWMEWGRLAMRSGQDAAAEDAFLHALSLKPDMPYAAFQIGFIYFQKNQLPQADYYYRWCIDNFQRMNRQAEAWKSFASIREGLVKDESQAMAHWGVIQERMGHSERAVALYQKALTLDPGCADARYNLAVIYWRAGRWSDVVENLQALAASHPEDPRWRVYLPRALERLKQ